MTGLTGQNRVRWTKGKPRSIQLPPDRPSQGHRLVLNHRPRPRTLTATKESRPETTTITGQSLNPLLPCITAQLTQRVKDQLQAAASFDIPVKGEVGDPTRNRAEELTAGRAGRIGTLTWQHVMSKEDHRYLLLGTSDVFDLTSETHSAPLFVTARDPEQKHLVVSPRFIGKNETTEGSTAILDGARTLEEPAQAVTGNTPRVPPREPGAAAAAAGTAPAGPRGPVTPSKTALAGPQTAGPRRKTHESP